MTMLALHTRPASAGAEVRINAGERAGQTGYVAASSTEYGLLVWVHLPEQGITRQYHIEDLTTV